MSDMATAEELFAQMEEDPEAYADGPVDDIITIDAEKRTINIPVSEILFGVKYDKDVERKHFRCPKIVGDNIDLSAHKIYISYITSDAKGLLFNGDSGLYYCEDMAVDGDYITFSWLLSGNVFANPGFIAFKVLATYMDGENIKTSWNTTPAVGTVLMTVPDGQEIVERYPDVIGQILTRLESLESCGGTGSPGKQVELRNSGTAIQWRYVGDAAWTDLVQISDITGPPSKDGITPHIGDNGNWYLGDEDTGKPSRGEPGKDGNPGEEGRGITSVTIKADGHLQINYSDDTNVDVGKVVGENGLDGASGVPARQEMTASDTTFELQPNILYVFPEMAELTLTFATPADTTIANEYHVIFTSGATATTLTLPNTIKIPSGFTVEANKVYELSVLENSLTHQAWEATT